MIDFGLITALVAFTILIALLFDFYNGLNDSANAIATVVATRALPPWAAVLMASVFNFAGAFLGTAVAEAVGKGIVNVDVVDTHLILAGLLGALAWTALATGFGIPISVSHSLVGGLVGAALAAAGGAGLATVEWAPLQAVWFRMALGGLVGWVIGVAIGLSERRNPMGWGLAGIAFGSGIALVVGIATGVLPKIPKLVATVLFIAYSPLMGFLMAYIFYTIILHLFRRQHPHKTKGLFRVLQIGSSSFYALGHGTNDAQKTMGVITALLVANGVLTEFEVPTEVIVAAATAIGLGTLIGGYKVVRTMGSKLTHLDTSQGFAAETSSALGLFFLADHGVPVSTTHSITGSILGVGAVKRVSAVSWGVARRIVMAWIITIPASALVAATSYGILSVVI